MNREQVSDDGGRQESESGWRRGPLPNSAGRLLPIPTSSAAGSLGISCSRITEVVPPESPATAVGRVADLIDTVYEANARIAAEADRLLRSRAALRQTTVDRFVRLSVQLNRGARATATLSDLDPGLLLAGVAMWLARRRIHANSAAPSANQG